MPKHGRRFPKRSGCLGSAPDRMTSFSRSADYGRSRCGSHNTTARGWKWPDGSGCGPRSCGCFTRALESDPGYAIWKRDFTGASGLFGVVLKPVPQKAVDALLDSLKLFGMGYSWGGFESLIIPFDCTGYRTATPWAPGGPTLRLHIGLENVEDLKADLAARL